MSEKLAKSEHADRLLDEDDHSDGGDEPSQESTTQDDIEEAESEQSEGKGDDPDLEAATHTISTSDARRSLEGGRTVD